ncbi:Rrf2 family transcriptional regulator [Lacrimispora sp. 38-1]|uniref:Rrf2 family transcriptional regulator n=1 Tax=Lacrimispora sp. 38-1 TaxID=3125778 RepID=UPI003CE7A1B8
MRISNKCSMALHVLILLGVFADQKLTSEQIANSVGCNPVMIRNLLGKLKEAGLVATQRGSGGSVLTKDPAAITVWMVYQAVDSNSFDYLIGLHPSPSPKCTVGKNIYSLLEKPYNEIKDAMRETMKTVTLQQLLEDYKNMTVS